MSPPVTHRKQGTVTSCQIDEARREVIDFYEYDVIENSELVLTRIFPWFQPSGLVLHCLKLQKDSLPRGVTFVGNDRFQYNLRDPAYPYGKRYRPVSYRVPFLGHPNFYDKKYTVSHLCHNNWCHNWNHFAFETLEKNKARNGCPAGPSCRHRVKCLVPGPYSQD